MAATMVIVTVAVDNGRGPALLPFSMDAPAAEILL
jgi:hypothetical protein